MSAVYLYLGILSLMGLYALVQGMINKEFEAFVVAFIAFGMITVLAVLYAFALYPLMIAFFLLSGLVLIAVSDLGLIFMNPMPWKTLITEFPTYTGIMGLVAIVASSEIWISYNTHWDLFQIIYGTLMTVSFLTAFIRIFGQGRSGSIIVITVTFAAILYITSKDQHYDINRYLYYWTITVIIQSMLLFIWRCAVHAKLVPHIKCEQ